MESYRWSLVVGLILLLAACGSQHVNAPLNASPSDGEPVPLALAQALTLGMKVSAGGVSLQEAKDLKLVNETVFNVTDMASFYSGAFGMYRR